MVDMKDTISKLKSFPVILLIINGLLLFYINSIRGIDRTIISINDEIYNGKNNIIYISILALLGLIIFFGLFGVLLNYRNVITGEMKGVVILLFIYLFIYSYHFYLSVKYILQGENITQAYKDEQLNNYTYKITSIIVLCLIILYIGWKTHSIRGKYGLSIFTGLYMLYVFLKIWDFTIERDFYTDINMNKTEGTYDRYIFLYIILIIIFILNLVINIKVYNIANVLYLLLISLYNIWIISRNKTLVSKLSDILFPFILFIFYSILNFKDFQENSINTKFVYGLGFLITLSLIYIITNTEDIKIKSFITIFLVVIYNILAIVYGSKDCDISGFKLLTRGLKWTVLIVIITFILWKDFFQTSINDNLEEIGDTTGGKSELTDTQELERQLQIDKSGNRSEIREGDRSDERVQLQSKINRLYESRARGEL